MPVSANKQKPLLLLYIVYTALALITVRIIFRLIEYAEGFESSIPTQEAYQYVFDSTPMLIALVLFNVVHPGRVMPGKDSDFPSRKARRAAGKNYVWGRADKHTTQAMSLDEYGQLPSTGTKFEGTKVSAFET